MKASLLTKLRDRNTSMVEFKRASNKLATILATEVASEILEEPVSVHSPLKEVMGKKIAQEVVLVPILRAGVALLPAFLHLFENARVGFFGIHRDEQARPHLYYEKIPLLTNKDRIILLDPMIATGGSTLFSIKKLIEAKGDPRMMTVVGMIGAPDGVEAIRQEVPEVNVKLAALDEGLDEKKFIVPGLGDFGDRFFGC